MWTGALLAKISSLALTLMQNANLPYPVHLDFVCTYIHMYVQSYAEQFQQV